MTRSDLAQFAVRIHNDNDANRRDNGMTMVNTLDRVFSLIENASHTGEGISTTSLRAALEDRAVTTIRGEV